MNTLSAKRFHLAMGVLLVLSSMLPRLYWKLVDPFLDHARTGSGLPPLEVISLRYLGTFAIYIPLAIGGYWIVGCIPQARRHLRTGTAVAAAVVVVVGFNTIYLMLCLFSIQTLLLRCGH